MIHVERHDGVTELTIDRPERRNALDHEALDALGQGIEGAAGDVVVLRGAEGHFCAGADLTAVEDAAFADRLRRVLVALRETPAPAIAAVEGAALGAGTQLAIACDLRTATPGARFGIPAARLGLMVDHWTIRRAVALVGHSTASRLLLSVDQLTGEDAQRLGLVHRLGEPAEALAWAAELASLAPLTLAGHKLGLRVAEGDEMLDPGDYRTAFTRAWQSADLAEGIAAFGERRPARFSGR